MLPVVIYKTGDMDSLSFNFKFQLNANENFVSGISAKTSLKIKVGYLQKPPTWGEFTGTPMGRLFSQHGNLDQNKI